jgi:hypothetical protein
MADRRRTSCSAVGPFPAGANAHPQLVPRSNANVACVICYYSRTVAPWARKLLARHAFVESRTQWPSSWEDNCLGKCQLLAFIEHLVTILSTFSTTTALILEILRSFHLPLPTNVFDTSYARAEVGKFNHAFVIGAFGPRPVFDLGPWGNAPRWTGPRPRWRVAGAGGNDKRPGAAHGGRGPHGDL